jgi:hypothetical protein
LPVVMVIGRFARAARLDVIAERVQGNGDLAARLVDPLSDLRRLVEGDTRGDYDRRGDYDAYGEMVVRSGP